VSQPEHKFVKSSAVLIAAGKKTRVYKSVDEVPSGLRKRLIESTNSINSGTILIANRAGRERILDALRSLPKDARSQIFSALKGNETEPGSGWRSKRRILALALSLATAAGLWFTLAAWWRT